MTPSERLPSVIRFPHLDEIITSPSLTPVYQPIFDFQQLDPVIYGFESLTRYHGLTSFLTTEILFAYAERKRRITDFDLACLRRGVRESGPLLEDGRFLFLNLHPAIFQEPQRLLAVIENELSAVAIRPSQLVLEITEQASLASGSESSETIEYLRSIGVRFALDDVGVAYSHLALIGMIRPAFLKISQDFGTGFEQNDTRFKIVRNIVSLARDFGSRVVLEGIESRETLVAARELGIEYGQGYYLGRPKPAEEIVMPVAVAN